MKRIAVLAFLALGACSQTGTTLPGGVSGKDLAQVLVDLKARGLADLEAAEADALASGDTLAAPCSPALGKYVDSLPSPAPEAKPMPAPIGPVAAFQRARDARHRVEDVAAVVRQAIATGFPDYVKLGCAALVIDEIDLKNRVQKLLGG